MFAEGPGGPRNSTTVRTPATARLWWRVADAQAEKELEEYGTQAARYRAEARKWREQAFSFRGKNIQMITERCGDPEYWDKLDRNYETGINLGKLSPSELRALRRDMQMIFQDPGCQPRPPAVHRQGH